MDGVRVNNSRTLVSKLSLDCKLSLVTLLDIVSSKAISKQDKKPDVKKSL